MVSAALSQEQQALLDMRLEEARARAAAEQKQRFQTLESQLDKETLLKKRANSRARLALNSGHKQKKRSRQRLEQKQSLKEQLEQLRAEQEGLVEERRVAAANQATLDTLAQAPTLAPSPPCAEPPPDTS